MEPKPWTLINDDRPVLTLADLFEWLDCANRPVDQQLATLNGFLAINGQDMPHELAAQVWRFKATHERRPGDAA